MADDYGEVPRPVQPFRRGWCPRGMGGDVVELTVRFAGTLLSVTRVRRGERYVIGTAPNVDLAIGIVRSFSLVESVANGFLLRVPVGVVATCGHRRVEGAFVLARAQRIDLVAGLVAITVAHVADVVTPVPRPPVSRRLLPYAAVVLAAHVAVVATAMATVQVDVSATIPVILAKPPPRALPKTVPVKPPKPIPRAAKQPRAGGAPTTAPDAGGSQPVAAREHEIHAARDVAPFGRITKEQIAMITGSKDLVKELADVGPLHDLEAATAAGFGGSGGAFDPTKDPHFDSVKVGPVEITGNLGGGYRLPARGKFREVERPPIMGLTCDDGACKTVGELDRLAVRDHVEKQYVAMLKCYERHGRRETRIEVTLSFEISSDGHATGVRGGETAFGQCLERLVARTTFPREKPTQVTAYPIAFWRTSAG